MRKMSVAGSSRLSTPFYQGATINCFHEDFDYVTGNPRKLFAQLISQDEMQDYHFVSATIAQFKQKSYSDSPFSQKGII